MVLFFTNPEQVQRQVNYYVRRYANSVQETQQELISLANLSAFR
ncbi:hypothetical protein [Pontibacter qinzhouensis]|nr:hypothetical protein [Pontibacter qinzhouensis]